ncbi:uncharacterized protein [Hetaerina americana]|uniref:uncharacterized protein n=1 Tax=Hetaerina americana TaxID=62018 RepID=UPI003A7F3479
MVNWSSPDIVEWQKEATEIQQEFFENLGDRVWDYFKKDERWAVEKKIAFALFGEPTIMTDEENSIGYTSAQMTKIHQICHLIYKESNYADVYIAFLFVIGKVHDKKYCIPVIKVRANGEIVFFDSQGRRYRDWSDFRNNNYLPKSLVCYPLYGTYQPDKDNQVLLEFSLSPACALGSRVVKTLDKVTAVAGFGATAIGIAGLFATVAAPLAIASGTAMAGCGIYGFFRGSQQLHDRRTHKQTISPMNKDALNCWISALGGVFGTGSAVAVKRAAAIMSSGGVLGRTSAVILDFLNIGALSVSCLGIVNGLAYLVEKDKQGQLTSLNILQWSASVLFFYNAAINVKTANEIFRDLQEGTKNAYLSDPRNEMTEYFNAAMKETKAVARTMEGVNRLVKGISNIGSKDEFLRLVLKGLKKFEEGFKFDRQAHLITYMKMFSHTKAGFQYPINFKVGGNFFKIPGEHFKITQRLSDEALNNMRKACSAFQKNLIEIDETVTFELKEQLLLKLSHVLLRCCDSEQVEFKKEEEIAHVLAQTERFARDRGCSTGDDFVSYFEFILLYKRSKFKKMKRRYQEEKSNLISCLGDHFDEAAFKRKWNLQGCDNIENVFWELINQEIESNESLKREYDMYNNVVEILNESGDVKFHTSNEALVQFYHCFVIDLDERLTLEEFFDIIRRTVQNENLRIHSSNLEEINSHKFYYDKTVPVLVEVQDTDRGVFFESTSFQTFLEADGGDQ